MNKAPAFLFYAGDFLSSPDVQSMDTREVGAYVLLLLNAWQGDTPGHLLNNEDRIRRITRMTVAEWEVSRDLLLSKFPVADMGLTRYNPRMVAEAEKQAENRAKKAAAGKQGGRPPKKQNESENKQMLSEEKLMLSKPKANDKQNESLSISYSTTTNVVEKTTSSQPVKVKSKTEQAADRAAAEGTDTFTAETWLGLNDPQQFALICRSLTALKLPANLDTEAYRESIRRKVADRNMDVPASSMRNFIESFFMKLTTAELRTIDAAMPTVPTPKHELPPARQERPGQIIAIEGVAHDQSMNRMKLATYQGYWPTAQIHVILPRF